MQLNFLAGLIEPIINVIKNICIELNFELVDEYKNSIMDLIESEPYKYEKHKKNLKYIQVNCFCKNTTSIISKDIMFEDFGINVRITNSHFKDIFKDLIEKTNLFILNNNSRDKRFDWCWRATDYKNNMNEFIDINNVNDVNNQNSTNNDFFKQNHIYNETHCIDGSNEQSIENIESFKIIQKVQEIPKLISQNNISQNNIFQNINLNNNPYSIKQSEKQISKIISNSIIIEDESFSIPINNYDTITNNMTNDVFEDVNNDTIV